MVGQPHKSIDRRLLLASLGAAGIAAFCTAPGPAQAAGQITMVSSAANESALDVADARWTELLRAYTRAGQDGIVRVDYSAFKASGRAELERYLASLQAIDAATLPRDGQIAYWINLYNAKTIDIVLAHYPVGSIRDIDLGGSVLSAFTGGPWAAKVLRVSGQDLSLDDIEHQILRPTAKDPRIHYALNCASIGCPSLGRSAYTATALDNALDAAARAFVNHPRGATIRGGRLTLSSIYDWFAEDFGGADAGVLRHLKAYAEPGLNGLLANVTTIAGYGYDWSLNDV